jgi:hypothetical protein
MLLAAALRVRLRGVAVALALARRVRAPRRRGLGRLGVRGARLGGDRGQQGGGEQGGQRGGSFERVAGIALAGDIRLTDQHINLAVGMAHEVGIETGSLTLGGLSATIEQRLTKIRRRGAAGRRVVHHHTDVSPAMLEVLARLQATGRGGAGGRPGAWCPAASTLSRGCLLSDRTGLRSHRAPDVR